jgi:hypothetical protein
MAGIKDLPITTHVIAPLGETYYRGVIVEIPPDHSKGINMVYVEFTPPIPDPRKPGEAYKNVTCNAARVNLGWHDQTDTA